LAQSNWKSNESLAKLLRPAWKPALHWQKSAIAVDSWRVGFHPDRLSVGFARGSNIIIIFRQGSEFSGPARHGMHAIKQTCPQSLRSKRPACSAYGAAIAGRCRRVRLAENSRLAPRFARCNGYGFSGELFNREPLNREPLNQAPFFYCFYGGGIDYYSGEDHEQTAEWNWP
jgi:hypothetical protein